MKDVQDVLATASNQLEELLASSQKNGSINIDNYYRYLTMQYYLVKDVQVHFFRSAAHPALRHYVELRQFLINFAFAEEPGYEAARSDLEAMGKPVADCPLDMALWRLFFSAVIDAAPFVRLGATCLLQSLGEVASRHLQPLLMQSTFFSESNTKFLMLNFETQPSKVATLFDTISETNITSSEVRDLELGAKIGATLILRQMHWALAVPGDPLPAFDPLISAKLLSRVALSFDE
jgi:hypothetical protein